MISKWKFGVPNKTGYYWLEIEDKNGDCTIFAAIFQWLCRKDLPENKFKQLKKQLVDKLISQEQFNKQTLKFCVCIPEINSSFDDGKIVWFDTKEYLNELEIDGRIYYKKISKPKTRFSQR